MHCVYDPRGWNTSLRGFPRVPPHVGRAILDLPSRRWKGLLDPSRVLTPNDPLRKRHMILLELLMLPSNLVCDHLRLTDPHERGMMRMFVNMCLFSALCVIAFFVLWQVLA